MNSETPGRLSRRSKSVSTKGNYHVLNVDNLSTICSKRRVSKRMKYFATEILFLANVISF